LVVIDGEDGILFSLVGWLAVGVVISITSHETTQTTL
jgi:hypothetical protein